MSKYVSFKTQFKDGKVLMQALAAMGYTEIKNYIGNPVRMNDYFGKPSDHYADVLVPKSGTKGAYTDLGFERAKDGTFEAVIDDMNVGRYNEAWQKTLGVEYAEVQTMAKIKELGFVLTNIGKKQNGNRTYSFQEA
jgi:hypothetical protein